MNILPQSALSPLRGDKYPNNLKYPNNCCSDVECWLNLDVKSHFWHQNNAGTPAATLQYSGSDGFWSQAGVVLGSTWPFSSSPSHDGLEILCWWENCQLLQLDGSHLLFSSRCKFTFYSVLFLQENEHLHQQLQVPRQFPANPCRRKAALWSLNVRHVCRCWWDFFHAFLPIVFYKKGEHIQNISPAPRWKDQVPRITAETELSIVV